MQIDDVDDPEELYIPLERPAVPSINIQNAQTASDHEENLNDSSSDSDSSIKKSSSRRKFVPQKPVSSVLPPKRKNYNIWCSDLQTEVLTNNLVDCNVDQSAERTRDVESYNYKISAFLNDSDDSRHSFSDNQKVKKSGFTAKRKHDGHYVEGKKKDRVAKPRNNAREKKGASRKILPLTTSINDSEADIARDIANKLYEEKEELICKYHNL